MNDMSVAIAPKSDQLTADDLLAGPLTLTITEVSISPGTEQPVSIFFDGDNGKPWKPCKSMARVLVHCWGPDANTYVGRSVTLFRDPKVLWGGMEVGGIRVSHITHINGAKSMALTATKNSKKLFTVLSMPAPQSAVAAPPGWLVKLTERLTKCTTVEDVHAIARAKVVVEALSNAPDAIKAEINGLLSAALARVSPPDDIDDFPGDRA